MTSAIHGAQAAPVNQVSQPVAKKDSDGDSDKSGAASIGPAVQLSLSTTKNDAAQGDPDHDGH
jgi:hypothetical protein